MIKNNIKLAWRNLMRNKSYAAINIIGLTVGIAACLLIFLILTFETSFDNYHAKKDRIYRVVSREVTEKGTRLESGVPFPTSTGMRLDFPDLNGNIGAIIKNGGSLFTINGKGTDSKKFNEDDTYFAEPQFFHLLDFKWLVGSPNTALKDPYSVVLSRDEADKFLGDWHTAVGKTIKYSNKTDFKVTGIIENAPANSDFPLKVVMSYITIRTKGNDFAGNADDWVSIFGSHYVFIELPANVDVNRFNNRLVAFVKKHKPAQYAKTTMQLQALGDMHYNTDVNIFTNKAFSKNLLSVISLIGIFLLVIACVNFINLATAQAVNRSKEVGIRKVLGSNRKQLITQFISETLIITVFALTLAVVVAFFALPFFNNLLEIKLDASVLYSPAVIGFMIALTVCVTLLSGFYPAIVLSGYNPITALRNKIAAGKTSGVSLRRGLVVFQFVIAQFLVIGTLVIINQMDYFKNKSLGFEQKAIITVPYPNDSVNQVKTVALKDRLMQLPGVKDVSFSMAGPSDYIGWGSDFKFNNAAKPTPFAANLKWADAEYFKLYNLKFVAGHPYAASDTINGWVVNETLLHKLGIRDPQQALGKYIKLWDDKHKNAQIVGVIKDFNVASLREEIPPVLMSSWRDVFQRINIKIEMSNAKQTLAGLQKLWTDTYPDGIYEYKFLDDTIAGFYKSENQLSTLYKIFAGIAIFISCLGLYGLVSFMAIQRTKEVGIRKTLGASVANIVYLFSKEFTVLILIAFPISGCVGWYFMHQWLQDYVYRITIGPGIFVMSILASVAIAWIAVGYKAIKAALANPVKSLRSE